MRILYFSKDYSPHDHRFLSALSETEHEVFYLKLERNLRQTEDRTVPSQIQQVLWKGGQGSFRWRDVPRLTLDLKRVINEIKPDLIHAGPIQTCAFLAVLSGFHPILTMSWGFDLMQDAERNEWMKWVTRYTLKRSTFFTSDAQITRDKAIAYGMNPDRTVVFPWGVDLKHFSPEQLSVGKRTKSAKGKAQNLKLKPFVVFCNRSWELRYGVDVLARAFVKVANQRQDVSLLLLSGGSQTNSIRQILMNGGVLDRVQFGGQVSQRDLPRWYQMADLYISPSHVDGSSVSLMEALACGVPVLASDIPANQEWVREGVNGWLFPDGNADILAEKILAAMTQRKNLADIRRAARRSAEERADWKKNFAKLLEAYKQTIQFYRRSK
jgi:glycosyltransferase involved in cell wall biosynthesis